MSKKIKQRIVRTLLIPILVIVCMPFALLSSSIANATGAITISSTPEDQAASYWYYAAMKTCFDNASSDGSKYLVLETDSQKISAGQVFYNSRAFGIGVTPIYGFYESNNLDGAKTDGTTDCGENNTQLASKALQQWGITGIDLVCGMGWTRENGQSCSDPGSTNRFVVGANWSANFTNYITKTIFGGKDPTVLSAAAKYAFYSKTLIQGCTTGSVTTTAPTDAAANTIYGLLTGTDSSGINVTSYYNATADHTYSWGAYVYANTATTTTCKTLLDDANANFKAYISQKSCTTAPALKGNAAQISACADGANHTDIGYCATAYPNGHVGSADNGQSIDNSSLRVACYAGQGYDGADGCIAIGDGGSTLLACIAGAQHQSDPSYCTNTFPPTDPKPGQKTYVDANQSKRQACSDGQKLTNLVGLSNTNLQAQTPPPVNGSSTCAIPGIGWIVCPTFNFFASIADGMYGVIANFLQTNPQIFDTSSGTYQGWQIMRNFANVGFVIVFLIIIFSQISNVGITNYGVKKLLPRLIIAAILVNLSYFISQIAVDLSNILGKSLKDLMDNLPVFSSKLQGDFAAQGNFFTTLVQNIQSGGAIVSVFAGAGALAVFGGIGLMLPIVLTAVVSIAVTLLILVARQALVILLVVISPLAFLAILLPNTETYFKQWRKIFVALLLVYPAVGLLFGASHVAAGILAPTLGDLGAAVALVLPLIAVPFILKNALNAIPAIGNLASRLQDRANGNFRKQSSKSIAQSRIGKYAEHWKGERDLKRAQMQSGTYKGKNPYRRLTSQMNNALNSSGALGKFGSRALAQGDALADAEDAELLKNADSRVTSLAYTDTNGIERKLGTKQLIQLGAGKDVVDEKGRTLFSSTTFDSHARRAAMSLAGKAANAEEAGMMLDATTGMSAIERKTTAAAIRTSPGMGNAPFLGGQVSAMAEATGITKEAGAIAAIKAEKVDPQVLAGGNAYSANLLVDAVKNMPDGTPAEITAKNDAIARLKLSYKSLRESKDATLTSRIVKGGDFESALQRIDKEL